MSTVYQDTRAGSRYTSCKPQQWAKGGRQQVQRTTFFSKRASPTKDRKTDKFKEN